MNTTQRTILALGLLVAAIQCAVCPIHPHNNLGASETYCWLWEADSSDHVIDATRLAVQLVATAVAAAFLFVALSPRAGCPAAASPAGNSPSRSPG